MTHAIAVKLEGITRAGKPCELRASNEMDGKIHLYNRDQEIGFYEVEEVKRAFNMLEEVTNNE